MKIQRTLPPAAAPIYLKDIANGIRGMMRGRSERERFRNELQHHFGVKYCFLVSSGKAALHCILKALHEIHPDKNEVLIPAFNCYSVPSAIVNTGLKTRLCDIDLATLDFDFEKLAITLENSDKLLCVVPAHLFGLPIDVEHIRHSSHKAVLIVEDAAQAFGIMNNGKPVGLTGDVGFFSLGRGKAYSAVEGGVIVTNSDSIGKQLAMIVDSLPEYSLFQKLRLGLIAFVLAFFTHPFLFWLPKSLTFLGIGETVFEWNFPLRRLSPFQAGLTRGWKRKLDRLLLGRKTIAELWGSFFHNNPIPGASPIIKHSDPPPFPIRFPVYFTDPFLLNRIIRISDIHGLGISRTYPKPLDKIPELSGQISGEYPQAELCSRNLVTFPVHCYVNKNDIAHIKKEVCGLN